MDFVSYWQNFCAPYLRALAARNDERGASLVEYALLVALIAIVCIVAIRFVGGRASDSFSEIGASLA